MPILSWRGFQIKHFDGHNYVKNVNCPSAMDARSDSVQKEQIVGKEKMLITSIFSLSHNVFKSLFLQGH